MKIRTAFMTIALVAMLVLAACGVKDKEMEVTNVTVNGNAAEYIKVVDGPNTLKKVGDGLELTLKAELLKELVGINPDSLQVGNWYLSFKKTDGIAVMGMESVPLKEEHKAEIIDLMKGTVGDKKDLTFMQMIDNKDEIKRILKEAASFELNTELLVMEATPMIPDEVAVVTPPVTPPPKPPVVTPPTPPVQSQDWDKKLDEYSSAMDRYVVMRDKNPTTAMDIKRLQDQRTKVQTLQNALALAPDMTAAQETRFNQIKAKM